MQYFRSGDGGWSGSERCVTWTGCRKRETAGDGRRRRKFVSPSVLIASRHEQEIRTEQ